MPTVPPAPTTAVMMAPTTPKRIISGSGPRSASPTVAPVAARCAAYAFSTRSLAVPTTLVARSGWKVGDASRRRLDIGGGATL
jgi:hypothetical protein